MKQDMNTVVAIKADLAATFPDTSSIPKGGDSMPGRELGDLITSGLRKRGFDADDVSNEEPLFMTKCRSGGFEYEVLSYIYLPYEFDPIWAVECPPRLGFLAKLFGKSEEGELGAILNSIHDILKSDSRIRDLRWFTKLPSEPFAARRYGRSPMADT